MGLNSYQRPLFLLKTVMVLAMLVVILPIDTTSAQVTQDEIDPLKMPGEAAVQKEIGDNSGLPLPRFVSLSSDKARARSGPGLRYPIEWIYQRDGLPLEVVKEFENWRKVLDIDGQGGWIHVSLLSGDRTALINTTSTVALREAPLEDAKSVAAFERGLVVDLERCLEDWCRVRRADFSGWIVRNYLWGIYDGEEID